MTAPRQRRGRSRGFTVTEMMVVIGIVAILAALAAPNLGGMLRAQRIKTAAFDVFASLTFARSEAIKRNNTVTLTPNVTWAGGWQIRDANDNLLRVQAGWEQLTAAGPGTVSFRGTGRLAAAVAPIELTAVGASGQTLNRCITVDLSGRANVKEAPC